MNNRYSRRTTEMVAFKMSLVRTGLVFCIVSLFTETLCADVLLGVRRLNNANSPAVIKIDPATGTGQDFSTLNNLFFINSMASDNANNIFVNGFVSGFTSRLGTLNPVTGDVTLGPETSFPFANSNSVDALAWHPDFGLVGSGINNELISIDTTTGEGSLIGQMGIGLGVNAMSFSPDGRLYGWAIGGSRGLIEIDPTSGTWVDVNTSVGGSAEVQALEFSIDGSVLYGARDDLFSIDIDTGVATAIGSGAGITDIRGLAILVPEPSSLMMLVLLGATFLHTARRRPACNML